MEEEEEYDGLFSDDGAEVGDFEIITEEPYLEGVVIKGPKDTAGRTNDELDMLNK